MVFTIVPIILIAIFLLVGAVGFTPELRANFLAWRGKSREARKIFEYLLKRNPEKLGLYRKLAEIYYLENRKDRKAIRVFEIILKLRVPFRWQKEIVPLVARHYVSEGRKDSDAIKYIERAVEIELERLRK